MRLGKAFHTCLVPTLLPLLNSFTNDMKPVSNKVIGEAIDTLGILRDGKILDTSLHNRP